MLDSDLCTRDSCLDCKKLFECDIFRARYERKKASIQESRYSQALAQAQQIETKDLTIQQLENLCVTIPERFVEKGKIKVQMLILALEEVYGFTISDVKAYKIRARLLAHHPDILDV